MEKILFLSGVITLLTTTGCIVPVGEGPRYGGYHGHPRYEGRYERHSEVIVGPPVIIVRPPEIIVR